MDWKNLTAPNLGLLVYKRLYAESDVRGKIKYQTEAGKEKIYLDISKEAKTTPFDSYYKSLFERKLEGYTQIENSVATNCFTLKTIYPGLLCGSGYTHDSNAKGDIKIGFYFDHTTGQPVIPGSSVKGVLKSIFENKNDVTDGSSLDAFRFIINEIIEKETADKKENWEKLMHNFDDVKGITLLKQFKEVVFGKTDGEGSDAFFDAVINIEETGKDNLFLADDFITPHYPDLLKDPTPLMFLKVLPGISFEFRFHLSEYKNGNVIIPPKQKEAIFQKIILTLGLGAKTNVGYGQFEL